MSASTPSRARKRPISRITAVAPIGRMNIDVVGQPRRIWSDAYHRLLSGPWRLLIGAIVLAYLVSNTLFALGYMALSGGIENARPGSFSDAFFFSVQTMATIGYGKMVPQSLAANALVAVEALIGMVGVAMAAGLMFAKFSRPTARVVFSKVAVVGPYDGTPTLMFRTANERGNRIFEAQVRVVLARDERTKEGVAMRRFYDLSLSRERNAIFALTWTVLHPLTEGSPLFGATPESLLAQRAEIIVTLTGTDDAYSQAVHARHAYGSEEIIFGARFADVLSIMSDGRRQIDFTRFHDYQRLG